VPHRKELLAQLRAAKVYRADKVTLEWAVETSKTNIIWGLPETGQIALTLEGDHLRIDLTKKVATEFSCPPLELVDQLSLFCHINDDHKTLLQYILSQNLQNSAEIESTLNRRVVAGRDNDVVAWADNLDSAAGVIEDGLQSIVLPAEDASSKEEVIVSLVPLPGESRPSTSNSGNGSSPRSVSVSKSSSSKEQLVADVSPKSPVQKTEDIAILTEQLPVQDRPSASSSISDLLSLSSSSSKSSSLHERPGGVSPPPNLEHNNEDVLILPHESIEPKQATPIVSTSQVLSHSENLNISSSDRNPLATIPLQPPPVQDTADDQNKTLVYSKNKLATSSVSTLPPPSSEHLAEAHPSQKTVNNSNIPLWPVPSSKKFDQTNGVKEETIPNKALVSPHDSQPRIFTSTQPPSEMTNVSRSQNSINEQMPLKTTKPASQADINPLRRHSVFTKYQAAIQELQSKQHDTSAKRNSAPMMRFWPPPASEGIIEPHVKATGDPVFHEEKLQIASSPKNAPKVASPIPKSPVVSEI